MFVVVYDRDADLDAAISMTMRVGINVVVSSLRVSNAV